MQLEKTVAALQTKLEATVEQVKVNTGAVAQLQTDIGEVKTTMCTSGQLNQHMETIMRMFATIQGQGQTVAQQTSQASASNVAAMGAESDAKRTRVNSPVVGPAPTGGDHR